MKSIVQILTSPSKRQIFLVFFFIIMLVISGLFLFAEGYSVGQSGRFKIELNPVISEQDIPNTNTTIKMSMKSLGYSSISFSVVILNSTTINLSNMIIESIIFDYAEYKEIGHITNSSIDSNYTDFIFDLPYEPPVNVSLYLYVYIYSKLDEFPTISLLFKPVIDVYLPEPGIFYASVLYNILSLIAIALFWIYYQDVKYFYPKQDLNQVMKDHQKIMENYSHLQKQNGDEI